MVSYNLYEAEKIVLDFLRFPIPRTASQIAKQLRKELPSFYQKTGIYRTVKPLRENTLKPLLERGLILRYAVGEPFWKRARAVLRQHNLRVGGRKSRKVSELYQINFLYLGRSPMIYSLPTFPDINLDLVVLFFNFASLISRETYTWDILNLYLCYSDEKMRDEIRLKIHQLNFSEREVNILEKALDYYLEFAGFFSKFPFKANLDKALSLLEEI
ncbi:hypothetical protein DRN74_01250 [Candidatus Micrarchaeota archaeon]|nr:MAG: hypothetical protein DRN74_01250 [Candidatus Micrarchaeota archaeon]